MAAAITAKMSKCEIPTVSSRCESWHIQYSNVHMSTTTTATFLLQVSLIFVK